MARTWYGSVETNAMSVNKLFRWAEDVVSIQDGADGRCGGDWQRDAGQHPEEARKFGDGDEGPYGRSV